MGKTLYWVLLYKDVVTNVLCSQVQQSSSCKSGLVRTSYFRSCIGPVVPDTRAEHIRILYTKEGTESS
jgi:hypothetical protein